MFEIDTRSRKSIYEQLRDGFKAQILSGVLEGGAKLPSVRELSKMLTVNPNTVQKAYRELESQAYISAVPGLGTFVNSLRDAEPDAGMAAEIAARVASDVRELQYVYRDEAKVRELILEILDENSIVFADAAASNFGGDR